MIFGLTVNMLSSDGSANVLERVCSEFEKTRDNMMNESVMEQEQAEARRKKDIETTISQQIQEFNMPISYLDDCDVYSLSDVVATDMELVSSSTTPMYEYMFLPQNAFARHTMPLWKKQYTTNAGYLNDTKNLLTKLKLHKREPVDTDPLQCDKIAGIWRTLKNDTSFLEKYSFMEWDFVKHLNHSESFLQCISALNVMSPVMSLMIPVFVLIFPFLILKFQGIPLTFSTYLDTLKEITKNHFIGKSIFNLTSMKFDKMLYFIFSFAFYILQIYQNINGCLRFYRNIKMINENLLEMKKYVDYSIHKMDTFLDMAAPYCYYYKFCQNIVVNREHLHRLRTELGRVTEFQPNIMKFGETGYMLKCFYELHADAAYESGLRYSMGFLGYYDNLLGVCENLNRGHVSFATIAEDENICSFKHQYYPPLMHEDPVKNDCEFDKNIIISAPNKAGKTTILKTTTINIIFTQQLGCGFYESATLKPYSHIHSYLNIPDTSGRDSLFQAESRRCKEILDIIGEHGDETKYRHFCIFDELYSGTNPEEACKAGCAFLKYLSKFSNVDFMLTTHYSSICRRFKKSTKIENYKMEVEIMEDGSFNYTYRLNRGISKIKGAVRVLKDMNYPKEIIDYIENDKKDSIKTAVITQL